MSTTTLRRLPYSSFLLFFTATLFGVCLQTPPGAFAQTELASVYGRVTDQAGAVIVGAEVEIKNVETNVSVIRTTNEDGLYTIPSLHPGHYVISARKPGFKTVTVTQLVLNVQDNVIRNFTLQVGSISESITVTADSLNMNTTDAAVSTVVDRNFVEKLPLNGRSFQTLITLTPGVVLTPAAAAQEPGQFSVNGQRSDSNYFTIDGVSANTGISTTTGLAQSGGGALPGLSVQGGTNSLVSVDAMQEFRIQTSSFAPEFGRTPGGQVSILTRAGTNELHGSIFEYFRNDVLDANDWFNGFNRAVPLPKAKDRQNDFGAVLGGPITKNSTFFFLAYEGLQLRQPNTATAVVPSAASRQTAVAQIQPFLNAYPVPNGPTLANGFAQFVASYSDPSSLNSGSVRIDHSFGSKLILFGRYSRSPSEATIRSGSLSNLSNLRLTPQTFTVGVTHSLSSRINNEIRANYSTNSAKTALSLDTMGGATPVSLSSVIPASAQPQDSQLVFFILGGSLWQLGKNVENEQRQVNVVDNLLLVERTHQFKFGIDYRRLSPISSIVGYQQLAIFNGLNGATGALSGRTLSTTVNAFRPVVLISTDFSVYAQDTWKASPRLTLTYGIRWDINPAPSGKRGNDPFALTGIESASTLALAPLGTPVFETRHNNIAPRFGLAYQLNRHSGWETVLRGGAGLFNDLGSGFLGQLTIGSPFTSRKPLGAVPFPLTAVQAAPLAFSSNPPVTGPVFATDPNLKLPRTYQWNVALEQVISRDQIVSATYVAAIGRKLLRQDQFQAPNATFINVVTITRNTATSDYHALQVQYRRRLSHGLQALSSYTWSHSIDIASADSVTNNTPAVVAAPNIDRGNSNFDVRDSFTGAISYDIPSPTMKRFARAFFGGWSLDSFIFARTALPVDVIGATAVVSGSTFQTRPNLVAGVPLYLFGSQYPGGKAFNFTVDPSRPTCKGPFCAAASGQQGNFGRNVLRGFGAWQVDFAVRRQFHITDRLGLQFRSEFFNIFNHPNFGSPVNTLSNPLFGQSTQTLAKNLGIGGSGGGFNPLYQVGGPRSIQFALKLAF